MLRSGGVLMLAGATLLAGCDLVPKGKAEKEVSANEVAAAAEGGMDSAAGRRLCASAGTYERLKILAFEEARRVRGIDAAPLNGLLRASVVRMERPVVLSRDEGLGTTVCSGRLVLELPPGAAPQFNGMQRLVADVEYSAQEAADGSGPVFQISGAEPIIFRLASFGGVAAGTQMAQAAPAGGFATEQPSVAVPPANVPAPPPPPPTPQPRPVARPPAPAPARVAVPRPVAAPTRVATRRPEPEPAPARVATRRPPPEPAQQRTASARPSFNCRYASTPSEEAVCSHPGLAAKDRRMAAEYNSAFDRAPPRVRRELSRSRSAFLRRRERCRSDACVASVYDDRVDEIRAISGDGGFDE